MKRFKRILLVWGGDTPVSALLPWCRCVAEASQVEGVDSLWCRNAVVPEYPGLELPELITDPEDNGEVLLEMMKGIPVKLMTEDGDPLRSVLLHLAGGTYDLVIVSIHDDDSRNLAERLARKSPVGVLAVPPNSTAPPARIRLGVDFSDLSELCLDWADAFATLDPEKLAPREAVHVVGMPLAGKATMAINPERLREHVRELAGEQLREFLAKHSSKPEGWERVLIDSQSAGEALMRRGEEVDSVLTVIGCHGRNALSIALLGSHASEVIRRSDSAVLVVKRKNENLGFLRTLLGEAN
ncbi:universal stress protein [Haloferula sp.]|uniref:universal stress protein n=1 Tax=Haloferula sp. TaxID=2497595 RepID=UPI003C742006